MTPEIEEPTEEQLQQVQQDMTPEQMEKFIEFKKARLAHFEKEIPGLRIQKEYEELLTTLDELYLRRLLVEIKVAQLKTPEPPKMDGKKPEEQPIKTT